MFSKTILVPKNGLFAFIFALFCIHLEFLQYTGRYQRQLEHLFHRPEFVGQIGSDGRRTLPVLAQSWNRDR